MKKLSKKFIIVHTCALLICIGYFYTYSSYSRLPDKNISNDSVPKKDQMVEGPIATVQVSPIKKGIISEEIRAYGVIIPAPNALQTISLPYECRIKCTFITEGQSISKGEVLLEIDPSPDTRLQIEEAKAIYDTEKRRLHQVEKSFDLKLATNQELLQAKKAFQTAQLRLHSLKKKGITEKQTLRADSQGMIAKVYVKKGSLVAMGKPLLDIIIQKRLEARLGVEPEDISFLQVKRPVLLSPVGRIGEKKVKGKIRAISHMVNSKTRLIDVFISLPQPDRFMLGEYVQGLITAVSKKALVVPRKAVLPNDGLYQLFTVNNRRAVKHTVKIGLENSTGVEIISDEVKAGDIVVVLGSYELKDGMAVRIEKTK